jgi:hypothetical protein
MREPGTLMSAFAESGAEVKDLEANSEASRDRFLMHTPSEE